MDTPSGQVRVDYGGWISGPAMTLDTCSGCANEINLVGGQWFATTYADVSGSCSGSDDERHHPPRQHERARPETSRTDPIWGAVVTEETFLLLYNRCSAEVADRFYPKGRSRRRGEWLRDQGVLAVKLIDELMAAGVIKDDEADEFPVDVPTFKPRGI